MEPLGFTSLSRRWAPTSLPPAVPKPRRLSLKLPVLLGTALPEWAVPPLRALCPPGPQSAALGQPC